MNLSELSAAQLRRAADLKEQIEKLQQELTSLLGAPASSQAAMAVPQPKKRKMSAASRANVAAAARARWAKIKAAKAK